MADPTKKPHRSLPTFPPRNMWRGSVNTGGELRPLLEGYALNLLRATPLGAVAEGMDDAFVASNRWVIQALATRQGVPSGREKSVYGDLKQLRDECRCRPARLGRARGQLGRNISALARSFHLRPAEKAVLQFKVALAATPDLSELTRLLGPVTAAGAAEVVVAATGEKSGKVARALDASSALRRTGLLSVEAGTLPIEEKLTVPAHLVDLLTGPTVTRNRVIDTWLPRAPPPSLEIADYANLGGSFARLRNLLAAALDQGERGVHILLHGAAGSGKTELARLVAQEVSADLRAVGTADNVGFTPNTLERLGSLLAGIRILERSRSILLVEEMEDFFGAGGGGKGPSFRASRTWFNEIVERCPVPTIWVTEDASSIDPVVIRRFAMTVKLPTVDEAHRASIWARQGGKDLSPGETLRLAREFDVSPATISGVVRTSRLIGGGRMEAAVAEEILSAKAEAIGASRLLGPVSGLRYEPGLLNASVDLDGLAERLRAAGPRASAALCLHGPPGTGKSEWVRHLAERTGRKLHAHKVSDIESKWVGDAEKNLAKAFQLAAQNGAVLLFDEADSFLRDRRGATQRWEVTLTNEFLQHLESARGIVACTTNLFAELDPAVMRRFSLKVELDYLKPEAAARLFEVAFGNLLDPFDTLHARLDASSLRDIGPLAPGDFAAVLRRAPLLPESKTVERLLAELRREVGARRLRGAGAAGFRLG